MKINYRDYQIECHKDESITRDKMMFYSIFTNNGFKIISGFTIGKFSVRVYIRKLKEIIDEYYETLSDYKKEKI